MLGGWLVAVVGGILYCCDYRRMKKTDGEGKGETVMNKTADKAPADAKKEDQTDASHA